ncbi:MAG: hypothetical protein J3Q66DRAFT_435051, partial [Benniella sp.]
MNEALPLFLGFDLSTQQLKVIALYPATHRNGHSSALKTHSSFAVHFDSDLAHYQTRGGVSIQHDTDNGTVTAPVLMWVEALELVLDRMKESRFPFERVLAISGAAQQHGSVYWSRRAQEAFNTLRSASGDKDSQRPSMTDIFKEAFTVYDSPIWQDTSTSAQCREIEEYLGRPNQQQHGLLSDKESIRLRGQQQLAELTGSRAYERYTGSQILKIVQTNPEVYKATERISLVSSFLASLLMAQFAMIDVADGSGMNLLNIDTKTWDPQLTMFISQGGARGQGGLERGTLVEKLGQVDSSGTKTQGVVSKWFVERYGFRSDVNVVSFTGDNPGTVMAMHAEQGDAIVSLGTSDTLLLYTDNHGSFGSKESNGTSQASAKLSIGYLCHPVDPHGYLMLYCAKNGSLARENIRDLYAEGEWDKFNQLLKDAMESEQESVSRIGFYFFDREIWPPVKGLHRFEKGETVDEFGLHDDDNGTPRESIRQRANVLAICESQFLAMRVRSSQEKPSSISSSSSLSPPGISRILATGGASSNSTILQLLSNVFGVPVVSTGHNAEAGAGSAAWGAARKAFLYGRGVGDAVNEGGEAALPDEKLGEHGEKTNEDFILLPDLKQTRKYVDLMPEFAHLEASLPQNS